MNLSYMVIAHECPISVKDMSISQLQQKKGATKMEFSYMIEKDNLLKILQVYIHGCW